MPNLFTNYACILQNQYWVTHRLNPWPIEKEAYEVSSKMVKAFHKETKDHPYWKKQDERVEKLKLMMDMFKNAPKTE